MDIRPPKYDLKGNPPPPIYPNICPPDYVPIHPIHPYSPIQRLSIIIMPISDTYGFNGAVRMITICYILIILWTSITVMHTHPRRELTGRSYHHPVIVIPESSGLTTSKDGHDWALLGRTFSCELPVWMCIQRDRHYDFTICTICMTVID